MTDPSPPTNPGDIIVTGQRARAASLFAAMAFPDKDDSAGPNVDEKTPEDDSGGSFTEPTDEDIQCALPEGRRQWNADAKAKEAVEKFLDKARLDHNERDWENREFGALICEFSDGTIDLGEVISGEPTLDTDGTQIIYYDSNGQVRNPGVHIPRDGCGYGRPPGFVHTHFFGASGHPSDADFDYTKQLVDYFRAPSNASVYVAARYQNPNTNISEIKVSQFTVTEKTAAQQGGPIKWVNPNATPCPGDS